MTGSRTWRVLLVAVLVCAVVGPSAGNAVDGNKVYFKDSRHKPRIKPERIDLFFGAGGYVYATDLKSWRHWGNKRTKARGHLHYNTCRPTCASGNYKTVNGVVKLRRIRRCGDQRRYRKITFNFANNRPDIRWMRVSCQGYGS